MEIEALALLALGGIIGGFLAGMLGIGGGVVYVLIYTWFLSGPAGAGLQSHEIVRLAIANSAFALVFAGFSGCWRQYRNGNFHPKEVALIGGGGALSVVAVTWLLSRTTAYEQKHFAIVFCVIMIPVIIKMMIPPRSSHEMTRLNPVVGVAMGSVTGAIMAITGLGGGFIIVPVLSGLLRIPIHKTVSISLGAIAIMATAVTTFNLTASTGIAHAFPLQLGPVVLGMVGPVVAGVVIGTPIGVNFARRIPPRAIRLTFLGFCALTITKMLSIL